MNIMLMHSSVVKYMYASCSEFTKIRKDRCKQLWSKNKIEADTMAHPNLDCCNAKKKKKH